MQIGVRLILTLNIRRRNTIKLAIVLAKALAMVLEDFLRTLYGYRNNKDKNKILHESFHSIHK
ncbi:MAG TPA: hypothetical protein VEL11_07850 [Candidatus Bathyarchaeia archaeon]|nr:hypothetical protein [Candidatus Bathyarchaeia archaeon]